MQRGAAGLLRRVSCLGLKNMSSWCLDPAKCRLQQHETCKPGFQVQMKGVKAFLFQAVRASLFQTWQASNTSSSLEWLKGLGDCQPEWVDWQYGVPTLITRHKKELSGGHVVRSATGLDVLQGWAKA